MTVQLFSFRYLCDVENRLKTKNLKVSLNKSCTAMFKKMCDKIVSELVMLVK